MSAAIGRALYRALRRGARRIEQQASRHGPTHLFRESDLATLQQIEPEISTLLRRSADNPENRRLNTVVRNGFLASEGRVDQERKICARGGICGEEAEARVDGVINQDIDEGLRVLSLLNDQASTLERMAADSTSVSTSHGITIKVTSRLMPEQSQPPDEFRYCYQISIKNDAASKEPLTLISRKWTIQDIEGNVDEVCGPGVTGMQPKIYPGQMFEYKSFTSLRAMKGHMRGGYLFLSDSGDLIDCEIKPFALTPDLNRASNNNSEEKEKKSPTPEVVVHPPETEKNAKLTD